MIRPDYWTTAAQVCTPLELATLELHIRNELSLRSISLAQDVSLSTIRTRLFNAQRKILIAQRKDAA
jgi:hypothetical protein